MGGIGGRLFLIVRDVLFDAKRSLRVSQLRIILDIALQPGATAGQEAFHVHIPEFDRAVHDSGCQQFTVRTERQAFDRRGRFLKDMQLAAICHIPEFDIAIQIAGSEQRPVRIKRQSINSLNLLRKAA